MHFPVYIHIGPVLLHPHFVFETLAYFVGFRVYLYTRDKERIPFHTAMGIVVGAIIGAAIGSKVVYWLENPAKTLSHFTDILYLMEGKTIAGGLVGGLIGVEIAKKRMGWVRRTGDDFAIPLLIGISIGRIGCFLTGLADKTCGTPTTWFTGIDFGDGIPRHPTQLYEIAFLLCFLLPCLIRLKRKRVAEGKVFQVFMFAYFSFRFVIDFIKPTLHPYFGLNNVQVISIIMILYYSYLLKKSEEKGNWVNA